ncbi:hypothetical protein DP120_04335 [Planococcus halotolerans]|uniref:Uncharacterized protein n=1 Tax=Planococcus halotolerans TaxID=2233542 RepID=A0A365L7Y3_9BACL|nr:hypothetical protein DP120_04335 [Planococcus halotolerans]
MGLSLFLVCVRKMEFVRGKRSLCAQNHFCVVFDIFTLSIKLSNSHIKVQKPGADVFRHAKNSNVLKGAFAFAKAFSS